MAGSSKQQTSTIDQNTTRGPYTPAVPGVNGLIDSITAQYPNFQPTSAENGALANMFQAAQNGNPYAPQINSLATNLLNGGGPDRSSYTTQGLTALQNSLAPIANQSTDPSQNPQFQNLVNTLTHDTTDAIKSQYAGAGYTPVATGDYAQQLGRGISQGVAPAFVDAQNNLTSQRMAAANPLYEAGASTTGILSGLDQTKLGNQLQGVGTSTDALNANDSANMRLLQLSQMQRRLPLSNIGNAESLLLPLAQLGGTQQTNGTQTTQQSSNPGILGTLGQVGSLLSGPFGGMGLGLLGWMGGQ